MSQTIWKIKLSVPYVSQLGTNAMRSNNDCGLAMLLMLIRFRQWKLTNRVADLPTVDQIEVYTSLNAKPASKDLTFAQLIAIAARLGWVATYQKNLTQDVLINYLDNNVPVGVLVEYDNFNPSDVFNGSHFVVVIGYNDTHFLTHDPYNGGANFPIKKEDLDKAMKVVVGNSGSYQGLIVYD